MPGSLLRRLLKAERAAVAPTIGLSLFALIGVGGIAFDYARLAAMDSELQNAADQAALAAVTQLDGEDDAIARATAAAQELIANDTRFANDGHEDGTAIGVPTLTFYESYDQENDEFGDVTTDDEDARVVQVTVEGREAFYALTPLVDAISSGEITASAAAGLGRAICKVPPLMICNPKPNTEFNANNSLRGFGIQVVGQSGNAWAPGNFGFLDVGQDDVGAPDLLSALAYQDPTLDCLNVESNDVDPGVTAPAFDAINTRFDIYNFGSGQGSTLGACWSGSCPAAANVVKDLVRPQNANNTGQGCKLHNQGWQLPSNQFSPQAYSASQTVNTQMDTNGVDAMGLPRDNCHYTSYSQNCPGANADEQRIGDGNWARQDYFTKYHNSTKPSGWQTMTRYETYLWELESATPSNLPNNVSAGGTLRQYGAPQCSSGTLDADRDRRLVTVAIVDNCAQLSGTSVPAQIGKWVDMFLVEPAFNRGNGATGTDVYFEVVANNTVVGNESTGSQVIRRDVPYLIR
ncbi:MAG TPA: pilus assembly protein TadG-related protein [Rhizorhapis sp.]|uniref:pilus assembly protein TadG-related protein n=1 Tax=Rhizorhapis sp. TaxID=1968842 RepID=UPI002B45A635|nr:pilus assembly protein TadG-related protein [Rhizorhapis sp.]HKR16227.1 pilus assembly protein TadG-related protein [Rhizorhapis sp.]HKX23148.1 pilus assembly protein TadG-related protein [Rhizorhapis sp.]